MIIHRETQNLRSKEDRTELAEAVGEALQKTRRARGLSLAELSAQCGVSKSILSQIERNCTNPTLATVDRIFAALSQPGTALFQSLQKSPDVEKLCSTETPEVRSADGLCTMRILGGLATVRWLQWYHFIAQPGGVLRSRSHGPNSYEHLSVLQGALMITVGEKSYIAKVGETLRYRTNESHTVHNCYSDTACAFMVVHTLGRGAIV